MLDLPLDVPWESEIISLISDPRDAEALSSSDSGRENEDQRLSDLSC